MEDAKIQFCHLEGKIRKPLYKYYGNLLYAKDVIENKRIHLEMPFTYNDLYDGTILMDERIICRSYNKELINLSFMDKYFVGEKEARESLRKGKHSIGQVVDTILERNTGIIREDLIQEIIEETIPKSLPPVLGFKVSCFSEEKESLLMWAYYANSYAGVCLEFDTQNDNLLLENCVKVQYSNDFLPGSTDCDFLFRKSSQWEHEKEWRIACKGNVDFLPCSAVCAIYLGCRMPKENESEFIELGIRNNLRVYKLRPSFREYKIEFMQIV